MSACLELSADGEPPASAGGKARSLARLAAAGLPVPRAFAVTDVLFQALRAGAPPLPARLGDHADIEALGRAAEALEGAALPDTFTAELDTQLDRLEQEGDDDDASRPFLTRPARFSVRSSFSGEDRRGALGAGVYTSVVGIARDQVPAAIRQVLASALSPGAVAYAGAHGQDPRTRAVGVLVHRYLDGEGAGAAAWDPHGATPPTIEVATGTLAPAARAHIDGALRALAARGGPTEIEWVARGDSVIFLQLRGYDPAPAAARWAGGAALADGDWRWDAAHNPLPLSPAQAGLIALVEERCRIGIRQRVAGGYLFYAAGGPPPARTIAPQDAQEELARLGAQVDQRLAALGSTPALEETLDLFAGFYDALFGAIQPALRRGRDQLAAFLREHGAERELATTERAMAALLGGVESVATERRRAMDRLRQAATEPQHAAALGDYLARFGAESPVWDVARPTYREDPSPLLAWLGSDGRRTPEPDPSAWARAARDVDARLPDGQRATFAALLARARQAVALGEEDDFVYARVQAAVRAALVALGKRLAAHGLLDDAGDVFWLPLDTARALARGDAGAGTLRRLVAAARDEQQRALASPPPSIEPLPRDGRAVDRPTGHAVVGKTGSGGRAIGRVWLYANVPAGVTARSSGAPDATTPPAELPIIVAPTLLPTELPLLPAAALVVETGGVLGHVAAQARERGIPAIVGAAGACAAFATGDLVLVDGDAGVAVKLGDGDRGDSLYGDAPTR